MSEAWPLGKSPESTKEKSVLAWAFLRAGCPWKRRLHPKWNRHPPEVWGSAGQETHFLNTPDGIRRQTPEPVRVGSASPLITCGPQQVD